MGFKTPTLMLVIIILTVIIAIYLPKPLKHTAEIEKVKSFSSEKDFKSYLEESMTLAPTFYGTRGAARIGTTMEGALAARAMEGAAPEVPTRVSATTVQVIGIDEPDIVKTDGKDIYFSSYSYREWWGVERAYMPYREIGETKVIKAFPPKNLAIESKINKRGDLLLYNNILVIFSFDKIYGYDVSDPTSPKMAWTIGLNSSIVAARLYNDRIYLVTVKGIDEYHPCPIIPLTRNGVPIAIECSRIYHPVTYVPIDVTYNVLLIDPSSGKVEKTVSFVGSSSYSILYMSKNAIYVTYFYFSDVFETYLNFLKERCADIIPMEIMQKLEKIKGYEISTSSKMTEFGIIMEKYSSSLDSDERMRIENEIQNRMTKYIEEHERDFSKSGIVKIGLDLEILTSGSVPGRILNQFSLDEYENYLRIATTVSGFGEFGGGKIANDIYVLDSGLNIIGSIQDLGLTERIYSVRFLQDKGYVVTFREIDPFFVVDLSNPTRPELKGQLKIPGYSSYLHPITKDRILGIGKEGSKVKVSLFDVTLAENPQERDKYILDEYWSDILTTYHAFLLDEKHEIFFLPASKGGYIFSYRGDKLDLVKTVSERNARRAIYIEDYLYIISDSSIVVLDEYTWEKVSEVELL